MSGKKLITQTEMTCPRDIVKEGECGRDPMKDVESGLSSLHLSPGCEQLVSRFQEKEEIFPAQNISVVCGWQLSQ
ncbi:hypothetical protein pdam_00018669 [Pocillopora damicornis]|uniref:Uncharacterized protein n=1 Tax=Pocillopora damicornis TaxID=46731 RepID=A0A3M6ULX1_POCDA|nr:hypothetical protein pdam_00018669 [Pocillopora damicornis]